MGKLIGSISRTAYLHKLPAFTFVSRPTASVQNPTSLTFPEKPFSFNRSAKSASGSKLCIYCREAAHEETGRH